jgi:hypothetical protein
VPRVGLKGERPRSLKKVFLKNIQVLVLTITGVVIAMAEPVWARTWKLGVTKHKGSA